MELSCTHGRERVVDDVEKRTAVFRHGMYEFQVAHGEAVKAYVAVFLDACDACDVRSLRVSRHFKVVQDGSCRHDARLEMFDAEALQRLYAKVVAYLSACRKFGEGPVLHLVDEVLRSEKLFCALFLSAKDEDFLWLESRKQFVGIFCRCCKEVVLAACQGAVSQHDAWCDELCDATFYELLCEFRVFELVADGDAMTCTHQTGKVGVEGVMWKSRHLYLSYFSLVGAVCERDAKYACCNYGIVGIGFVEVAASEQQQSVGMLVLKLVELPHHGRVLLPHSLKTESGLCLAEDFLATNDVDAFRRRHDAAALNVVNGGAVGCGCGDCADACLLFLELYGVNVYVRGLLSSILSAHGDG